MLKNSFLNKARRSTRFDANQKERTHFLTRAEFLGSKDFPKSNSNRIIIPSNSSGSGFVRYCYNDQYLQSYLSENEFNQVVDHITNIVQKLYLEKRKNDDKKVQKWIIVNFSASFILVLLFFFFFYFGSINHSYSMKWIGYACLITAVVIVLFNFISNSLFFSHQITNFEQRVKEELDKYFDDINKFYMSKGLFWRVVPGHYWVELKIDRNIKEDLKKIQTAIKEPPINIAITAPQSSELSARGRSISLKKPSQKQQQQSNNDAFIDVTQQVKRVSQINNNFIPSRQTDQTFEIKDTLESNRSNDSLVLAKNNSDYINQINNTLKENQNDLQMIKKHLSKDSFQSQNSKTIGVTNLGKQMSLDINIVNEELKRIEEEHHDDLLLEGSFKTEKRHHFQDRVDY